MSSTTSFGNGIRISDDAQAVAAQQAGHADQGQGGAESPRPSLGPHRWVLGYLAMPAEQQRRKFRFAMMSAARRGEGTNISAAIARFAAGSDAANLEVARLEAIEQAAAASIRAAKTIVAKRAAYAGIAWAWQPTF